MCGIAGIYNRDASPIKPSLLVEMTRTMIHRGPDEEGYFINSGEMEGWETDRPGGLEAENDSSHQIS